MSNISTHYWSEHTVCIPSGSLYFPRVCHILYKITELWNTILKHRESCMYIYIVETMLEGEAGSVGEY